VTGIVLNRRVYLVRKDKRPILYEILIYIRNVPGVSKREAPFHERFLLFQVTFCSSFTKCSFWVGVMPSVRPERNFSNAFGHTRNKKPEHAL
jgi:hypothetical protein